MLALLVILGAAAGALCGALAVIPVAVQQAYWPNGDDGLIGSATSGGWRFERPFNFWTLQVTIARVAVGALLGLSLATLAFCVVFRSYRRRAPAT